jgi:hypothetical protein
MYVQTNMNLVRSTRRPRLLLVIVSSLLLIVLLPGLALAQADPDQEGCGCHSAETEAWQHSPHALAAIGNDNLPFATCEDCHGSYVRGHPDDGTMALTVDSKVCRDCHDGTFGQWDESVHAEAGVQCIGCHLPHSQTLRLSDQDLCNSCHREALNDNFHIAHDYSDVSCISCHPAPQTEPQITEAATGDILVKIPAPNHDFVTVSANSCVECHSQEIGQNSTFESVRYEMAPVKLVEMAERVPVLTAELKAAEQEKGTLAATSVVSLGLGIGTGGVLGILFVLVVGFVAQRRSKR